MIKSFISTCAVSLALITTPVYSQTIPCGTKYNVEEHLSKNYGEMPVLQMQSSGDPSVTYLLFLNQETLTWTYIVVSPEDGQYCLLSSGEGFEFVEPEPQGEDL